MQMNRALGYYRLQFTRMIAIESKLLFTVYKVSVCPAKSLINSIFNWVTLVSARFAPDTFWINWLCAQSIVQKTHVITQTKLYFYLSKHIVPAISAIQYICGSERLSNESQKYLLSTLSILLLSSHSLKLFLEVIFIELLRRYPD